VVEERAALEELPIGRDLRAAQRAVLEGVGEEGGREVGNGGVRRRRSILRRVRHYAVRKSNVNEEGFRAGGVSPVPGDGVVRRGVRGDHVVAEVDDRVVNPAHASVAVAGPVIPDDIAWG